MIQAASKNPMVQEAARIAYLFKIDILEVLRGDYTDWTIRKAGAEYIVQQLEQARIEAENKAKMRS